MAASKKFRSVYDRVITYSCPGDPLVNDYTLMYDDDGSSHLEVSGTYSLFDQIQSHRDSCDLELIIKRFEQTGDVSLLQRKQGFYGDMTEFPKDYADMLRVSQTAKEMFDCLKVEDKEKFNNDPDQFLASIGTKKFEEVFGKYQNPGIESPVPNDSEKGAVNES